MKVHRNWEEKRSGRTSWGESLALCSHSIIANILEPCNTECHPPCSYYLHFFFIVNLSENILLLFFFPLPQLPLLPANFHQSPKQIKENSTWTPFDPSIHQNRVKRQIHANTLDTKTPEKISDTKRRLCSLVPPLTNTLCVLIRFN